MGGKVRTKRLLISVSEKEHRLIQRAAKIETEMLGLRVPVATFIRRAAVQTAQNVLGDGAEEKTP